MKLIYNVEDKPQFSERVVFAFQQLLAIMAATIAVPAIVGNGMTASAALFGAGVGTLVYQLFTKFRSPVFLGSSFAFLGSMFAAFAGGVSMSGRHLRGSRLRGLRPHREGLRRQLDQPPHALRHHRAHRGHHRP